MSQPTTPIRRQENRMRVESVQDDQRRQRQDQEEPDEQETGGAADDLGGYSDIDDEEWERRQQIKEDLRQRVYEKRGQQAPPLDPPPGAPVGPDAKAKDDEAKDDEAGAKKKPKAQDLELFAAHAAEVKQQTAGESLQEATVTQLHRPQLDFAGAPGRSTTDWHAQRPIDGPQTGGAVVPYPKDWDRKHGKHSRFKHAGRFWLGVLRARNTY